MSSANYWKARHNPLDWNMGRYERSWRGDHGARLLECFELTRYLKGQTPHLPKLRILELGCGAFTWDELEVLPPIMQQCEAYLGLDVSWEALQQAKTESQAPASFTFQVCDLTNTRLMKSFVEDFKPNMLLTRRAIQNLTPTEQLALLDSLPVMDKYFMIEETQTARTQLSLARASHYLEPLADVPFNWPLTDSVIHQMARKHPVVCEYPFASYFYITRVMKQAPVYKCKYTDLTAMLANANFLGPMAILPRDEATNAIGVGPALFVKYGGKE